MIKMEKTSLKTRINQMLICLVGLAIASVFIVPPLMAPQYKFVQGAFNARILNSTSGMGMGGRLVMRARIEDETGRFFWLNVPSTITASPDTSIMITAWCETEAYENCIARYRKTPPHP
ncbi:MAG: hypothetical protein ABJG15_14835 [Hyphomonadaceae bacterium]